MECISSLSEETNDSDSKSKITDNNDETTEAGNMSAAIPDEDLALALEKLGDLIPLAKAMHSRYTPKQEKVSICAKISMFNLFLGLTDLG